MIQVPSKRILEQEYKEEQRLLKYQRALSLFARELESVKGRVILTLDGRDTAGKWYTITNATRYLNPNSHTTKFFPRPTDEEKELWLRNPEEWFKRYAEFFPEEWKITFFDRSWYNRALVELVMWFCSREQYEWFMENVNRFESSIQEEYYAKLVKVYLSVSKKVQAERLEKRKDPLTNWKVSIVDQSAQEKWDDYTWAKWNMLQGTNTWENPWHVIDSNTRIKWVIEVIRSLILSYPELAKFIQDELKWDQKISLTFNDKIHRMWDEEYKKMQDKWKIWKIPQILK